MLSVSMPTRSVDPIVRRFLGAAMACLTIWLAAVALMPRGASANDDLWAAIGDGAAVVVMRHALAPGTGDPADFDVNDCATQRNLSEEGRAQARAIGDAFRANGITQADILSSAWCRCLETGELLDLGPVENLPALDSFFRNRDREPDQTAALIEWLAARTTEAGPAVLVTHQVNITALTGVFPRSGEMVVVEATPEGDVVVLGRM
ncbi:histidine phosphatase family protein [Bauldia sp.]|uniref:histidine phosphatase family protein n=1 Tax=Bauldia sp. TaxID=2575872 RepID=UPI003BAC72EA